MTDKNEITEAAEIFLGMNYSNLLGVNEPVIDKKNGIWKAEIIYVSKIAKFNLGLEMIFDSKGRLIMVPSLEKVHGIIDKKFHELGIKPEVYPKIIF